MSVGSYSIFWQGFGLVFYRGCFWCRRRSRAFGELGRWGCELQVWGVKYVEKLKLVCVGFIWGFPKIRGTLFWAPYNKDPTI